MTEKSTDNEEENKEIMERSMGEDYDEDENDDFDKQVINKIKDNDEDDDDEDEDEEEAYETYETYAFRVEMVSNFFFLSATVFYLIQSMWDLQYANHIQGISKDILEATDDVAHQGYDDDYDVFGDDTVFTTKRGNEVSLYAIIYFCGATCFVLCGIADCCNPAETSCFAGFFFILAGLFDVAASVFVDSAPDLSNKLDLVSSCLYLFEAVQLFWNFEKGLKGCIKIWTCIAYFLFGMGALMDVCMGFIATFENVDYSHSFAVLEVFDSVAWMGSGIILCILTIYRRVYNDDDDDNDTSSASLDDHIKQGEKGANFPSTDVSFVDPGV